MPAVPNRLRVKQHRERKARGALAAKRGRPGTTDSKRRQQYRKYKSKRKAKKTAAASAGRQTKPLKRFDPQTEAARPQLAPSSQSLEMKRAAQELVYAGEQETGQTNSKRRKLGTSASTADIGTAAPVASPGCR